jgi:iron complex outermembrane receptor protein
MPLSQNTLRHLPVILFISAATLPVQAETSFDSPLSEQEEIARLMAVIDEQTEIATKSRLNADFVPGIVTVLRGSDLELRGVRNVWEALSLVPGLEQGMEETGRKHILIRGVGLTYASENAKIMVNGVSYNTTAFAFADAVFNIPVEQVERIEVIRGPGSAVYGEFAYSGVINVITYKQGSKLFSKGTSRQDRLGGGIFSFGDAAEGEFYGTLNIAAENGKNGVSSGYDAIYSVAPAWSYAPGETNEESRVRSTLLDLSYRDYSLKMAWISNGFGDYFGINSDLPPDSHVVTTDRFSNIEISRTLNVAPAIKGELTLGQRRFDETKDHLYIDKTSYWCASDPTDPSAPADPAICPALATYPADIVADLKTRETARYASAELQWEAGARDIVYVEMAYTDVKLNDHILSFNADPNTFEPQIQMVEWGALLTPGTERHIFSTTLQDQHRFGERLLATAGVRYDNYSDVGSSVTPRLATVWSIDDVHLFKAQASQAFRPPTFYEQGGAAGSVEPSTVDTYELSYISKHSDSVARMTGYYSRMEKVINFVGTGYNSGDTTLRGIELEYDRQLARRLRFDGNLSLMKAYDNATGTEMPNAAMQLANLALTYTPSTSLLLNTQYRYVGPRAREVSDIRDELASYQTVDLTLSMLNVTVRGLTLRGGVRNLFDETIRYPAPPDTYPDDYPRPGRYWWAGIQYNYD